MRNSAIESRFGNDPAPENANSCTVVPFNRKPLDDSRWPFTERLPAFRSPETWCKCKSGGAELASLPARQDLKNWSNARLESQQVGIAARHQRDGGDRIRSLITCPICVLAVSICTPSPETSTFSLTWPTFNLIFRTLAESTSSRMPVWRNVVKPRLACLQVVVSRAADS